MARRFSVAYCSATTTKEKGVEVFSSNSAEECLSKCRELNAALSKAKPVSRLTGRIDFYFVESNANTHLPWIEAAFDKVPEEEGNADPKEARRIRKNKRSRERYRLQREKVKASQ